MVDVLGSSITDTVFSTPYKNNVCVRGGGKVEGRLPTWHLASDGEGKGD